MVESSSEILVFISLNWWWISILVMAALIGLKSAAKKTKWAFDDKIVTFLIGIVRMSMRKDPTTGKKKDKK